MSQITELFDTLLGEVSRSPNSAVPELLERAHALLDVLPIATTLRPMQKYNLLQGLLHAQSEALFFERVATEPEQKQAVARYAYDKGGLKDEVRRFLDNRPPALRRLFFESGSTIAHLVGHFAVQVSDVQRTRYQAQPTVSVSCKQEEESAPPLMQSAVITNNLTGVTALAGLVEQLEPIQGRLSLKYLGFFPFSETESTIDWQNEGRRYSLLADDIESCDAVFATCSNFSFLGGPIVGTRANCLTKRSMYSGAERWDSAVAKNFYVLFHFEKIVPLVNAFPDSQLVFDVPKKRCGCVFMQPSVKIADATTKWLSQLDEADPVTKAGFTGTWHDELRNLSKEGRHPYTQIKIPVEDFLEAMSIHRVKVTHRLELPWPEWLEQSCGLHILIAVPRTNAAKAIQCVNTEITRANQILALADCKFRFIVANPSSALEDLVVQIDINSDV
jgi:hypothetical protein